MALAAAYKHDAYMSLDFFDSGLYRPTCTAVARLTLALAKLSCSHSVLNETHETQYSRKFVFRTPYFYFRIDDIH